MSMTMTNPLAANQPATHREPARPSRATLRRRKATEFWLYFAVTFPVFLLVALFSRLMPKSWRPFPSSGRGVFGDAKSAAYTVLPFVFMG
ncbi:MAG: hypothetical protein KTR21_18440 [Rhodobacteraceae bacterium]|nr:hypothetical protein [Paracoccaceae bacterium]